MANSKTSQCCRTIYFIVLYISDHFCFIDLEFNVLIRPHWVWQKITNSNIIVNPGNDTLAFKSFETTIETTNNSNVCLVVLPSNMKSIP